MLDAFRGLYSEWLPNIEQMTGGGVELVGMRKVRKAGGQTEKEVVTQQRVEEQDLKPKFCHS